MRAALLVSAVLFSAGTHGQTCVPPQQSTVVAYPSGTIIAGVGTSDIPVTSKSEKCKTLVKQGFALIHCFWFNEAVRSFRDATKEDPSCAIAWCGLNVAENMPWNKRAEYTQEAEYAIRQAVRLWETAGPLEQELIIAFRTRDLNRDDRNGAFNAAMQELISRHPDAFEPRLLLAGIRTQICMNDRTLPSGVVQNELIETAALIEPILAKDPKNPGALHYKIHAFEGSRPEMALAAARTLGSVAPASAHMVHMPGHIFNVLGLWNEADKAFAESTRLGKEYAKALGVGPGEADWNYGHNEDYWGVNFGEQGRLKEALAHAGGRRKEILWRLGDWKALAKEVEKTDDSAETDYYKGMAAANLGQLGTAKECRDKLLKIDGSNMGNVGKMVHKTRQLELEGLVYVKSNEVNDGLEKLQDAVKAFALIEYEEPPYYMRPPQETLGQVLTELGRYKEAVAAYQDGLKVKRNAGTMLFGIARAYEAAGDQAKARTAYVDFLKMWAKADEDRPQIVHAKGYLANLKN